MFSLIIKFGVAGGGMRGPFHSLKGYNIFDLVPQY